MKLKKHLSTHRVTMSYALIEKHIKIQTANAKYACFQMIW